jgi:serine/threonine-protein kinase RsbW
MSGTNITLRIPSLAEFVAVARLTVAGIASRMGFPYDAVDDIKVAVGEACTNAIEHAAPDAPHQEIEICCCVEVESLVISITDRGKGFDPALETQPDPLAGGGLGLVLIRALMDEVELTNLSGKGTQVRMVKRLGKPAPLTPAK